MPFFCAVSVRRITGFDVAVGASCCGTGVVAIRPVVVTGRTTTAFGAELSRGGDAARCGDQSKNKSRSVKRMCVSLGRFSNEGRTDFSSCIR